MATPFSVIFSIIFNEFSVKKKFLYSWQVSWPPLSEFSGSTPVSPKLPDQNHYNDRHRYLAHKKDLLGNKCQKIG